MDNAVPQSPQAPRTPTVAEVRARVQDHVRNAPPRRISAEYVSEINRYKRWVEQNRLVRDGKYLTRDNVNLYFTSVQQIRNCVASTGGRVINALQAYADREEYAGADTQFQIRNAIVEQG